MLTGLMRMTVGAACLLLMGFASAAAAQEPADRFAQGEAAYAEVDLEAALTHYQAAWRGGIEDGARLALVHLRLGTLHAMLGRADEARGHFAVAVALDPSLEAPAELPPALRGLFDAAMEARAPYEVNTEQIEAGPPTRLRITASASLEGVAETLSVTVADDAPRAPSAEAPFELTVPLSAFAERDTVRVVARALDAHGGLLAASQIDVERPVPAVAVSFPDAPPPVRLPDASPAQDDDDEGILASPWFWLTSALVMLAAGGLAVGLAVGLGQDVYEFGPPTVSR